jgi:hypothetical protein
MVSFVHGLLAVVFTAYYCLMNHLECGETNNSYNRNVLFFSVSYFTYDLIAMWMEGLLDKAMAIHHPLCMVGLFIPLYENIAGNFCMAAILVSEISNPPMHVRHILRITGRRYTKAYEVAEISFIVLYVFARTVFCTPIVYQTVGCQSNHIFLKVSCLGLFLQSVFFVFQMVGILRKRTQEIMKRKQLGIKFSWLEPLPAAMEEKLVTKGSN